MAEIKKTTNKKTGSKMATSKKTNVVIDSEQKDKEQIIKKLNKEIELLKSQIANRPLTMSINDPQKITLRWQAEVADNNIVTFGQNGSFGRITGKTGIVSVPKEQWSTFYTPAVRRFIDRRWLIVLSGMDEDELAQIGALYKEGEILDAKAFFNLLDMGRDIIAVFPQLCKSHKEMIAKRFFTAYTDSDPRAQDRELIVALNNLSKAEYKDTLNSPKAKGLFYPIIELMNEKEAE